MRSFFRTVCLIIAFTAFAACSTESVVQQNEIKEDASFEENHRFYQLSEMPDLQNTRFVMEDKDTLSAFVICLVKDADFLQLIQTIAENGKTVNVDTVVYTIDCHVPSTDPRVYISVYCESWKDGIRPIPDAAESVKALFDTYYETFGFFPFWHVEMHKEHRNDTDMYTIRFEGNYVDDFVDRRAVLEYRTDPENAVKPDLRLVQEYIQSEDFIVLDDHFSVLYINY